MVYDAKNIVFAYTDQRGDIWTVLNKTVYMNAHALKGGVFDSDSAAIDYIKWRFDITD